MSERADTFIECPIADCEGLEYEHTDSDQRENIHRITGREIDATMTVDLVMVAETWPAWAVDVDTWHAMDATTPLEALDMAEALRTMAARCMQLNRVIESVETTGVSSPH
jgi:hypothetical protein